MPLETLEPVAVAAKPGPLQTRRLPLHLTSDDRRVITRPFIMSTGRVRSLWDRIDRIPEDQLNALLRQVEQSYADRHFHLANTFREHFDTGVAMLGWSGQWSPQRRLLAGAFLTMEYAIDSAALFNPSIVPHPDQSDVPAGSVRFIMSLRATGEGHVSSIVFRTGLISDGSDVFVDPLPGRLHRSRIAPDRQYLKGLFRRKLSEIGINGTVVDVICNPLPDWFTLPQLMDAVRNGRAQITNANRSDEIIKSIVWLAQSNYHVDLADDATLSELVIFPMSEETSHGLEDLRLTRFVDDDGAITYYGTYTAYNGVRTLPMLLSTTDFHRIEFASLNGVCALNKGMALFPRKINGKYVMCSRIDGERLFISTSDAVHFWETAQVLIAPKFPWELMQIGNCGAPIETDRGWLLLTHGVGPMRTYAIGAMLLDLEDPLKILGHLKEPLIAPEASDREGYVPNVVYTCGAMVHQGNLLIPFAKADKSTGFVSVVLDELLDRLVAG